MSLYDQMKSEIVPAVKEELGLKNAMAAPRIEKVKIKANKADMPYQTLIKQYIYKGLGINS